jgi:hypothetical protein
MNIKRENNSFFNRPLGSRTTWDMAHKNIGLASSSTSAWSTVSLRSEPVCQQIAYPDEHQKTHQVTAYGPFPSDLLNLQVQDRQVQLFQKFLTAKKWPAN